jgi:hypothetical protein
MLVLPDEGLLPPQISLAALKPTQKGLLKLFEGCYRSIRQGSVVSSRFDDVLFKEPALGIVEE